MKIPKEHKTLEEELLLLKEKAKLPSVSIEELLHILSGKGRFLILILLCIPFCQPFQIPGLSAPFGLAVTFIGLRVAFGKRAWLPEILLKRKIPLHILEKISEKALILVKKMKVLINPRFNWICNYPIMEIINGLVIAFLGILLALPLPIPMSNLTAAWSIFLIALGLLEDNGIFVIIGYIASLATVVFLIASLLIIQFGLSLFWPLNV